MTLRARLTLFFIGIVVVPLLAATLVLQSLLSREAAVDARARLEVASRAVADLWEARLREARAETRLAAGTVAPELRREGLSAPLEQARSGAGLDFLVLGGPGGRVLAAAVTPPRFRADVEPPEPAELLSPDGFDGALLARIPVEDQGRRATLVGGWYTDQALAEELAQGTGFELVVTAGDRVLASTLSSPPDLGSVGADPVPVSGDRVAVAAGVAGRDIRVVVVGPAEVPGGLSLPIWLIILVGIALAAILGTVLARLISEPLQDLEEGARAVARGDLQHRLQAEGPDFASIAAAFNTMTENLQQYVGELHQSRDELRRSLDRLGVTLRSTHDLEAMLGVILDTAAVTLRAKAGALYLLHPGDRELRPEVAVGYEPPEAAALRLDQGIAGVVASTGRPVLLSGPDGQAAPQPPVEPPVPTALAVPLLRGERSMGVLALYGRTLPDPFASDDLDTLGSFAAQASVAIENVLLHQEAQRLSITDGLTGVWNRRYLSLTLTKEIERAQRFDRPLSILMVDVDHFKDVNDQHGHLRGDEVLVELTQRILGTIRSQIDTLSRYGGEEFVIVLPETPRQGARVVANKLRRVVRRKPFSSDAGPDVSITVSIGIGSYPQDGDAAEDLLRAADVAMYRAKRRGRDRVEAQPRKK